VSSYNFCCGFSATLVGVLVLLGNVPLIVPDVYQIGGVSLVASLDQPVSGLKEVHMHAQFGLFKVFAGIQFIENGASCAAVYDLQCSNWINCKDIRNVHTLLAGVLSCLILSVVLTMSKHRICSLLFLFVSLSCTVALIIFLYNAGQGIFQNMKSPDNVRDFICESTNHAGGNSCMLDMAVKCSTGAKEADSRFYDNAQPDGLFLKSIAGADFYAEWALIGGAFSIVLAVAYALILLCWWCCEQDTLEYDSHQFYRSKEGYLEPLAM